jgi:hypothetical protein
MNLEETLTRLEKRIDALKTTANHDRAFRQGFAKGLCFALLMAQGRNVFDPQDADLQALRKTKTKRGQLDLF